MTRAVAAVAVAAALVAAACDDMSQQAKVMPFAAGGTLTPPPGTVARGDIGFSPAPVDARVLARGADRFAVFCAPCHGVAGDGIGRTPTIPPPPSLFDARLRAVSVEAIAAVIADGKGTMYPMKGRVAIADRWAIAAWVRHSQQREEER